MIFTKFNNSISFHSNQLRGILEKEIKKKIIAFLLTE